VRAKIPDILRGVNEFKKSYQPRSNLVKDENSDSLVSPSSVWKLKN
jgi:hypothetical protein